MKKYLPIILIGLLFFCFGFSPHMRVIARKNAGGLSYVLKDNNAGGDAGIAGGYDTTTDRWCLRGTFLTTSAYTVKKIAIGMYRQSSGAQTVTVFICDADGDTNCVQADSTIDVSTLGTSCGEWPEVTITKVLADATTYAIVLSSSAIDATDRWAWCDTSTGSHSIYSNSIEACANASWDGQEASCEPDFKLWALE